MDDKGVIRKLVSLLFEVHPRRERQKRKEEYITMLLEADPHTFKPRPCVTCKTVSAIQREPFGCMKKCQKQSTD